MMTHRVRYFVFAGAALVALALLLNGTANPPIQDQTDQPVEPVAFKKKKIDKDKDKGKNKNDSAKEAVMANVKAFTEAYNQRDGKAILKLFADDCVLTEHDGSVINGLKELDEELSDGFKANPDAKISVSVESLHVQTPDVIIEEGKTTFYPDGKTLTAETDYQATHVKRGDRWIMTRVRSFNRVVLNPYDQLRDLEWLVGEWIDESDDAVVNSHYRWDKNKTFLLNDFTISVRGKHIITGTQRIGRDPLTKQVKSWVFDSEGGYAESLWTPTETGWLMKASGARADGKVVTMTNRITQMTKDQYRFESADRVAGEEQYPNLSILIVRKPPEPKR